MKKDLRQLNRNLKGQSNAMRIYAKAIMMACEFSAGALGKVRADFDKISNAASELLVSLEDMDRVIDALTSGDKQDKKTKRELDRTRTDLKSRSRKL